MDQNFIDPTLAEDLDRADRSGKVDVLFEYMQRRGNVHYEEEVTQLEHALQAADLARSSGASARQITSALLHDLGHLLVDEPEGDLFAMDLVHEEVGAAYLAAYFPPEVTIPIAMHVPAKRYLCSVDDAYYDGLSVASKKSFEIQGGKMSAQEQSEFETSPFVEFACKLRRWDDEAKRTGLQTNSLESFRDAVLNAFATA